MAVVIVQSRATAHVYRVFGALVALLLLMALAVGLVRARADRGSASPYGSIGALAQPPVQTTTAVAAAATSDQTVDPAASPPAVVAVASPDLTSSTAPADTVVRTVPREIAIDKAAAGATMPQPAPPAVVQAAARAAAAAPPSSPVTGEPTDAALPAAPPAGKPSQAGLVNINTASIDQLDNIPGGGHIGRSIARHRPYRSLEDLVDHRVLKARDFARIKAAITVE